MGLLKVTCGMPLLVLDLIFNITELNLNVFPTIFNCNKLNPKVRQKLINFWVKLDFIFQTLLNKIQEEWINKILQK